MIARGELGAALVKALEGSGEVSEAFGDVHVDVPTALWLAALLAARDVLGLSFLDWLSAYDDSPQGLCVVAHVVDQRSGGRVLVRTRVPSEGPSLPSATTLWPGAAWHERETWEMFGIVFEGHPALDRLLLQPSFEGRPLRKDFVLVSRVVKPWPGRKDPADAGDRPRRRSHQAPGVPSDWGRA
jgi:NADH-quinone oxidoreductase subunit C